MNDTSKKKQAVLIAIYGKKPKSMRQISESIGRRKRAWSPVFLPSNPSAFQLGETANQHNIQTYALYLETPKQLTLLQQEIKLLQRLTHNNVHVIVGGTARTSNGKLRAKERFSPDHNVDEFVDMLDEHLDQKK